MPQSASLQRGMLTIPISFGSRDLTRGWQIGRNALASHSPIPFRPLAQLLYSEKKPGDLCVRQVIIELFCGIFDVFPTKSTPAIDQGDWSKPLGDWSPELGLPAVDSPFSSESSSLASSTFDRVAAPGTPPTPSFGASSTFELVRSLVLGPPDEKEEAQPDFMKQTRRPRRFKRWIKEVEGVVLDYFWCVFHPRLPEP
jgi:hypothetical protein